LTGVPIASLSGNGLKTNFLVDSNKITNLGVKVEDENSNVYVHARPSSTVFDEHNSTWRYSEAILVKYIDGSLPSSFLKRLSKGTEQALASCAFDIVQAVESPNHLKPIDPGIASNVSVADVLYLQFPLVNVEWSVGTNSDRKNSSEKESNDVFLIENIEMKMFGSSLSVPQDANLVSSFTLSTAYIPDDPVELLNISSKVSLADVSANCDNGKLVIQGVDVAVVHDPKWFERKNRHFNLITRYSETVVIN